MKFHRTAKAPRTPGKAKTITAEAQGRRGNAGKSYNRKGAKAQRKAAKNFLFEPGFPLRTLCAFASLRLQLFLICFSWRPWRLGGKYF
ncbi:MAG TPA: hypothetical protein VFM11_14050 [Burkholderiales bacterium]|nr:hypothetical protein [Burkholderiales bacterium]